MIRFSNTYEAEAYGRPLATFVTGERKAEGIRSLAEAYTRKKRQYEALKLSLENMRKNFCLIDDVEAFEAIHDEVAFDVQFLHEAFLVATGERQ